VVKDNGTGMPPEKLQALRSRLDHPLPAAETPTRGIGLWNVQQRIRLFYGRDCRLEIESVPGEGTTVVMKLPEGRVAP